MKTSKTPKIKERLELDEELLCFNGNTILEKAKVTSVDKKAKTATLSNQVVISRYPDSNGCFLKQGKNSNLYIVKRWDDEAKIRYKSYMSRSKVSASLQKVIKLLNDTWNPMASSIEDNEILIKLETRLSKTFKDKL